MIGYLLKRGTLFQVLSKKCCFHGLQLRSLFACSLTPRTGKVGFPLICCNTLTSSKAGHAQSRNCRCSIMRKTWHCSDFCSAFFAHCHLSWRWSQAWKLLLAPTCEHLYDLVRLFGLGTYIQDYTSFFYVYLIYIYTYRIITHTLIYIYLYVYTFILCRCIFKGSLVGETSVLRTFRM